MWAATRKVERTLARPRNRLALHQSELKTILFVGDAIAATAAATIAPFLWAALDRGFAPRVDLSTVAATFVMAWVAMLWIVGSSDLASPRFGRNTMLAVVRTMVATGVLVFATFFFAPYLAPRGSTLLTLPIAAAATMSWRFAYLRVLRLRTLERRVAIVGTDSAARRVAMALDHWDGPIRYHIVAFLTATDDVGDELMSLPVVNVGEDPWSTVSALAADLLVVGHTQNVPPPFLSQLTRCFEHGVEAVPATMLYEQLTGRVLAAALEADWYAQLPTYAHGLYVVVKRLVDIVAALAVGTVALALTPFIAVAIVVDSGLPVFYRQIRVGLRGEPFVLHKFRTMRPNAEDDGPTWTVLADPRITRVGLFLRRTRLDELPQLWDVLRGAMSLIGPRPERPEFFEQLARELPLYRARTLVRPGISGWAQVQFPYAASVEENLAKLEYDLYYVRHFGPLLDASIALRTIEKIVSLSGR